MQGTSFLFASRSTRVVPAVSVIVLAPATPGFGNPNVPQAITNATADMLLRGINGILPAAKNWIFRVTALHGGANGRCPLMGWRCLIKVTIGANK